MSPFSSKIGLFFFIDWLKLHSNLDRSAVLVEKEENFQILLFLLAGLIVERYTWLYFVDHVWGTGEIVGAVKPCPKFQVWFVDADVTS